MLMSEFQVIETYENNGPEVTVTEFEHADFPQRTIVSWSKLIPHLDLTTSFTVRLLVFRVQTFPRMIRLSLLELIKTRRITSFLRSDHLVPTMTALVQSRFLRHFAFSARQATLLLGPWSYTGMPPKRAVYMGPEI
jgi:hypothetical protein